MRAPTLALLLFLFACDEPEDAAVDAPMTTADAPNAVDAAIDAVASTCMHPVSIVMAPADFPSEGGYEAFFNHAPRPTFTGAEPDNCSLTTDVSPGQPILIGLFDDFGATAGDFWVMPISATGWKITSSSHGTMNTMAVRGLPNNTEVTVRLEHMATGRKVAVTFKLSHAVRMLTIVDLVVFA